jgi:hypothetical protein
MNERMDSSSEKKGSENKDLSDPSYNLKDFHVQLTSGRLRWLCTILAVAGSGLFAYQLTQKDELEVYFPIHLKGNVAMCVLGAGSMVMLLLAVVNWKSWLRKKR